MRTKIILIFLITTHTISLSADSLRSIVRDTLHSNPIVNERLQNYRATKAEIDIAKAGYYPSVNLESAAGRKTSGKISNNITNETFSVFQNSLRLKQNLFSGFETDEKVKYQTMRTLSASYSYLAKVNDVTLQVVNVYLDLQREKSLLENTKLNVKHNDITYKKVKKLYDAGLSTFSEVNKIQASLSLTKSNLQFQKHKLTNAHNQFKRVTGIDISNKTLQHVSSSIKLPRTQLKAEAYAVEYSPSILMGYYNVKGAKALYNQSKSAFYPKVDLELSQNYNENYNEFIGTDDRSQGLVVVSYNLYNGGEDEAKKLKRLSQLDQEVSISNDTKREVRLRVQKAWNSYQAALDQIPFLKQYKNKSQETLSLYNSEYPLGQRSLLDLISVENDLKRANDELIYAKNSLLRSKYNMMHAMGLIVVSLVGNEDKYYNSVGIKKKKRNKRMSKPKPVKKKKSSLSTDNVMNNVITEFKKVRWKSR